MHDPVRSAAEELLERERELARLASLARRAAGGNGGVALVRGPAGSGKTRLLQALRAQASAEDLAVLSARGGQLERDFAFGIARQLFEPVLARAPRDRRDRLLAGAAGLAGPILGVSPLGAAAPALEADHAVLHGLFWLTANLATDRAVLVCIDDAHWADAPSLRWIAYLGRRLEGLPVLLALGVRTGEAGPATDVLDALADEAAPEVVEPLPLSEAAVAVLVGRRLGQEPDRAFAAACHAATGGNPFLVSELLASAAADGLAPLAVNAPGVDRIEPGAVAAGVLRRVARLGAPAEALAGAVALLGTAAELRHAAQLAGLELDAAAHAADRLAGVSVLAPGRPLEFAHPIVRRAVHGSLSPAVRAEGHARAAHMLTAEGAPAAEVARHLLHTEPAGSAWTVEVLREAARDALSRGAPDVASTLLARAVREPPDPATRAAVLRDLGRAELGAGDRGDAMAGPIEHLRAARTVATDPDLRARAALDLGVALWGAERTDEAVDVLVEEAERLEAGDRDLALRLEAHLVATGWLASTTSRRVAGRLRRFEPIEGRTTAERLAAGAAAFEALARGAPAETVAALADRALRGPAVEGADEVPPPPWPIVALTCIDRFAPAMDACDAAIADARAHGALRMLILLTGWRSAIGLRRGTLLEAESDARHAFELAGARGFALDLPATRAFLVEVLVEQGRLEDAARVVDEAAQPEDVPPHIAWNWFRHARGRLRLARGDAAEALEDQLACGAWLAEWGGSSPAVLPWRSAAALAHLALGEDEPARHLAAEELEAARRAGAPRAIGRALRVAGLARSGEEGEQLLAEALDVLGAGSGTDGPRLELAHALVDGGRLLRRLGRRGAARDRLRAGMDVAHRCGARALVEQARQELVACGGRPRRAASTGRDALTPSEARVAERAAAGLTNREIAQELFVTPRTVEVHLTRVFSKLGVRSRTALPEALAGAAARRPRATV